MIIKVVKHKEKNSSILAKKKLKISYFTAKRKDNSFKILCVIIDIIF